MSKARAHELSFCREKINREKLNPANSAIDS